MERATINNKIIGVTEGYVKVLLLKGVGYRATLAGRVVNFTLGFSHPCEYKLPDGITVVVDNQTKLTVSGIDKDVVGQVAAEIRQLKPPEPYQGKGVMYEDEKIRRKAGKSAAGAKAK
jgi:large subunit ribosomal protein L6